MRAALARSALLGAVVVALLAASARAAERDTPATQSLESWAAAARLYPDDPDVAWAYALALADASRDREALQRLRSLASRWPERASDAAFKAGTIHWARGERAAALRAFDDAIEADPMRGDARLYRALALQALGRDAEAERELRVVAQIAPDLAPDALLLRGLERVREGDRSGSLELLSQVVALDPTGGPATQARAALALIGAEARGHERVISWATFGGESDSNVLLDSGIVPSSDRADIGLVFGAGLAGSLFRSDRFDLSLGYSYNGSLYHDLKTHDLQAQSIVASSAWLAPALGVMRLDAALLDGRLGGSRYLTSALVRPNLVISFGESSASLRLYGEVERRNYQDDPLISSLNRDGSTYGAGLEQILPLPFWPGASSAIQASLGRTNTRATPDLLGFEGDFDSRRAALAARLRLPLGARCDAELGGGWTRDRYVNANLIDALTDDGVGTSSPRRRHDVTLTGAAGLGCELLPRWRIETRWSGSRDRSNVDVYNYRRSVIGLYLCSEFGWL